MATSPASWLLVRPFNLTRVIFGMKPVVRSRKQIVEPERLVLMPQKVVE